MNLTALVARERADYYCGRTQSWRWVIQKKLHEIVDVDAVVFVFFFVHDKQKRQQTKLLTIETICRKKKLRTR